MKYYDKLIFELSKEGRCGYSLHRIQVFINYKILHFVQDDR